MEDKEVIMWLKKKDPYAWHDLESLAKRDHWPVIIDNDEYEFFIKCVRLLAEISNKIENTNKGEKVDLIKSSQLGFEVPELTEEDIKSFGRDFLKNIDEIAEIDEVPE